MERVTNVLQLRVLLSFLQEDEKACTVTGIARTLREEKYTISRAVAALEKLGLLNRANIYRPVLTEAGRASAVWYEERISLAESHLIYEGVDLDSARFDAFNWALYNSDSTMEILRKYDAVNRAKYELREKESFDGTELCRYFEDGSYHVNFFLYRAVAENGRNLSMGNAGFEHPATLAVSYGTGRVLLRTRQIEMRSDAGDVLRGGLQSMKYYDHGGYTLADKNGRILSFPVSAISFENIGTGMNQMIHGTLSVKVRATVGENVMPESTAVFTMVL